MTTALLTPEQSLALKPIVASAIDSLRRRAQLLLLYHSGLPTREVAAQVGLSPARTRYWRRQFTLRGMAIFPPIPPSPPFPDGKGGQRPPEHRLREGGTGGLGGLGYPEPDTSITVTSLPPIETPSVATEIPFPQPLPAPGILPDDPLSEAGRKTLLFHFAAMLSHEEGTRLGQDIEALHDMRVATRRMRTAFDIFGEAFKPKRVKPFMKGARAAGRALGRARDMDVLLDKLHGDIAALPEAQQPGLQPLLAAWETERAAARALLVVHLDSEDYRRFQRDFNVFLHTPGSGARPQSQTLAPSRVRDVLPMLVYTRLATVHAYESILPTATLAQLHALRIELKRLRYTIEYFREVMGGTAKQVINELKGLQDHLGELHDADVACLLIQQFLENWEMQQSAIPLLERQSPEPIVAYLAARHAERHRLMMSFPHAWAHFRRPEFQQNLALAVGGV